MHILVTKIILIIYSNLVILLVYFEPLKLKKLIKIKHQNESLTIYLLLLKAFDNCFN